MSRARIGALVAIVVLVSACGGPIAASPSGASSRPMATLPAPSEPASPASTEMSSPTPLAEPAVAVTCDGPAASVSAPAVRARPDGVHLEAVRKDGSSATIDVSPEDHGVIAHLEGSAALVLAPGAYELTCLNPSAAEPTRAKVLVTDPDGLWKPGQIECEGGGGTVGSGDEPPASPEEAIAYLRSLVLNFRPGDVLEPAGYPAAPSGWIRLVRDGQLAAAWSVTGSGSSMGIRSMQHCPDAGITYRESSTAAPPAPTPPVGTAAPPAPTALRATWQAAPCPDETGHGDIVLAHAVAATPNCLVVNLGWVSAKGTSAVYRIYEAWSGEGAGAACDRAGATLIATSSPNAAMMTVGPLPMNTGGGELCLYVAAANTAGESARTQFKGVSP